MIDMPKHSMALAAAGAFPPRSVAFLRAAGVAVAGILLAAILVLTLVGLTYMPAGQPGFAHLPGGYWATHGY
jgi:hypothetical protein